MNETGFYTFFERNGELIWFDSCDASMLHMEQMAGPGAKLVNAGKWMTQSEFDFFVQDWERRQGKTPPDQEN